MSDKIDDKGGGCSSPLTGSASECCADFAPGIEALNGIIGLQAVRTGIPDLYDRPPFRFCPWCGHKRSNVAISDEPRKN